MSIGRGFTASAFLLSLKLIVRSASQDTIRRAFGKRSIDPHFWNSLVAQVNYMTFALIYGTVVLTFVGNASGLDDHIIGFGGTPRVLFWSFRTEMNPTLVIVALIFSAVALLSLVAFLLN
jgi:hypothetical protein